MYGEIVDQEVIFWVLNFFYFF